MKAMKLLNMEESLNDSEWKQTLNSGIQVYLCVLTSAYRFIHGHIKYIHVHLFYLNSGIQVPFVKRDKYIYKYTYVYIYKYIYMYISIYIYIYIYIYRSLS
jgi:hypothetical protein